jgi:DNA-binding IclR family transcriptional regulator
VEQLDGLEEFLRVLSDGKTWKIGDVAEKLDWEEHRVERFCELVSEHDLVRYNKTNHSVRLDKGLKKLILQLDRMPTTTR